MNFGQEEKPNLELLKFKPTKEFMYDIAQVMCHTLLTSLGEHRANIGHARDELRNGNIEKAKDYLQKADASIYRNDGTVLTPLALIFKDPLKIMERHDAANKLSRLVENTATGDVAIEQAAKTEIKQAIISHVTSRLEQEFKAIEDGHKHIMQLSSENTELEVLKNEIEKFLRLTTTFQDNAIVVTNEFVMFAKNYV